MKKGIDLIAEERQRQISVEGYDRQHDAQHTVHEFILAAGAYVSAACTDYRKETGGQVPGVLEYKNIGKTIWPWDEKTFKPTNSLRDLVKAGALIASAIDRLQSGCTIPNTDASYKKQGSIWDEESVHENKGNLCETQLQPKFNFSVGQWIVATGKCVYCITKIDGFNVTVVDVEGNEYVFDVGSLGDARLWDITKDVKDGDILAYEYDYCQWILIYKDIIDETPEVPCDTLKYYALVTGDTFYEFGIAGMVTEDYRVYFHPATRQQQLLFFSIMHESKYDWNPDKKELINIE